MRSVLAFAAALLIVSLAKAESPATQPGSAAVTVRMLDTKEPVAGAKIAWETGNDTKGSGVTSATGEFAITGVSYQTRWISFTINHDGMVPMQIIWNNKERLDASLANSFVMPHFDVAMEKGVRVSGMAVDENGKPIAGAKIFIDLHKKYPNPNQYIDMRWKSVATDADGKWSFDGVPCEPDKLEVGGYDIKHLEDDDFFLKDYQPRRELYDGSAKLTFNTGIPVEVTVLKPDGSPAVGASVFFGHAHQIVDRIYPVKADAQGKVVFGLKPKRGGTMTAWLAGFGPARQPVSVVDQSVKLTVKLTLPTQRTMEFVDNRGRPIRDAYVAVAWWNNSETLDVLIYADANGRAVWNDGPADGIKVSVRATGYAGQGMDWPGGQVTRVVLVKPTVLTASVVDAESTKPIDHYTIRTGVMWQKGDRLIWQGYDWIDAETKRSPGRFVSELSYPADQYQIRVSADGYLPEDMPLFALDGQPHTFEFRLHKAAPITAIVVDESGKPVPNASVYLTSAGEYISIDNGDVQNYRQRDLTCSKTTADGRFSLPPQKDEFVVAILCPQGIAITKGDQFKSPDSVIHLQRWASVQGTFKLDGQSAAEANLAASGDRLDFSDGMPAVIQRYQFTTDTQGHFTLPRVQPGHLVLSRWISNHADGRIWSVGLASIDAKPGETRDLKIGEGPSVTGQLVIPAGKPWMIRQARMERKGQPHADGWENVDIRDDGHFNVDNLEPGEYAMHIALHEFPPNNSCGWGRVVGEYDADVRINSASIDIGAIQPKVSHDVQLVVGDTAPEFSATALDGKPVRLSDFKGKIVVVDFWATWCAPCVAELPNLQAIYVAHAADPHFALVSLSLDEDDSSLLRFVKFDKLAWPQARVGVDSDPIRAYGATAIPATFLIGPDGKILARGLRGDDLKKAIDAALRK